MRVLEAPNQEWGEHASHTLLRHGQQKKAVVNQILMASCVYLVIVLKHFLASFCVYESIGEKTHLGDVWVLQGKVEFLYKIVGIFTELGGKR